MLESLRADLQAEIADLLAEGVDVTAYAFQRHLLRRGGPLATDLAEAEARGRRQGLEEAARWHDEWQVRNRNTGAQSRGRLHGRYAAAIRSLATDPADTQKPETGESHHG